MTEVNDRVFRIAVKSRYSFTIGNTTDFSPYESKGVV
ncbi:MAG: hypothetical protein JST59_02790 [Actinobacteria bacterium]|nr:hypothetical protein [Actinomycetota bacterium]